MDERAPQGEANDGQGGQLPSDDISPEWAEVFRQLDEIAKHHEPERDYSWPSEPPQPGPVEAANEHLQWLKDHPEPERDYSWPSEPSSDPTSPQEPGDQPDHKPEQPPHV